MTHWKTWWGGIFTIFIRDFPQNDDGQAGLANDRVWPGNCYSYSRLLIGYWILATAWISIWAFLFLALLAANP